MPLDQEKERALEVARPMTNVFRYTSFQTAVGPLWVAYAEGAICLTLLGTDRDAFLGRCHEALGREPEADSNPPLAIIQGVQARLNGDASLEFDLRGRTQFQRAVLEAVAVIPRGEVRTYGEIALAVGRPGAARAVGEVMRTNQIPVLIPCHRVVRAGGDVGRYTPDPAIKRRLLESEGALPEEA